MSAAGDAAQTGAIGIINDIVKIAEHAETAGIRFGANWGRRHSEQSVHTSAVFSGDRTRFAQGLQESTVKTTTVSDGYTQFMNLCMETEQELQITETAVHSYEGSGSDLIAVPIETIITKHSPCVRTLDWDSALVDPTEIKPMYKLYNIAEGSRGDVSAIVNMMCTRIVRNYTLNDIHTFKTFTAKNVGISGIVAKLSKIGHTVPSSFIEAMQTLKERTTLVEFVNQRLSMQLASNVDMATANAALIANMVNVTDHNTYIALQYMHRRYLALKAICDTNFPVEYFESKMVSFRKIQFEVCGAITVVHTSSTALDKNGAMCQVNSQTETRVTESVLQKQSPLKRTVQWPTGTELRAARDSDIIYNRIQVPSANWDDVKTIQLNTPRYITQGTKSYRIRADTIYTAADDFYASVRRPGVKTARLSYNAVQGTGTFEVSYITAS